MTETTKPPRTTNIQVSDLIDLALSCLAYKNPEMAEYIIDVMPKIGQEDFTNYFNEMTMIENTKDDIEEGLFFIQEMLEKDDKWNYTD